MISGLCTVAHGPQPIIYSSNTQSLINVCDSQDFTGQQVLGSADVQWGLQRFSTNFAAGASREWPYVGSQCSSDLMV